jgi:hypothetical protein
MLMLNRVDKKVGGSGGEQLIFSSNIQNYWVSAALRARVLYAPPSFYTHKHAKLGAAHPAPPPPQGADPPPPFLYLREGR